MATLSEYINEVPEPRTKRALQALLENFINDAATALEQNDTEITATGAELNIMDGCSRTYAEINALLQCETAQYMVAGGDVNLDATEFGISTGLSSISWVATGIKSSSAPSNVVAVTWDASGGTLKLYGWKYTNTTTNTLVAASATASVKWIAIGPKA